MNAEHLQKPRRKYKNENKYGILGKREQDKACFQHDMAYWSYKDLARRTAPDKYLVIKHLNC